MYLVHNAIINALCNVFTYDLMLCSMYVLMYLLMCYLMYVLMYLLMYLRTLLPPCHTTKDYCRVWNTLRARLNSPCQNYVSSQARLAKRRNYWRGKLSFAKRMSHRWFCVVVCVTNQHNANKSLLRKMCQAMTTQRIKAKRNFSKRNQSHTTQNPSLKIYTI